MQKPGFAVARLALFLENSNFVRSSISRWGRTSVRFSLILAICLSFLFGCGGDTADTSVTDNLIRETTIAGSVGDGPIVGGNVLLLSRNGQIIANQDSDEESRYLIRVIADDADFPLIARVSDGTDLVTGGRPDFPMVAVVLRPGNLNIANLNPIGTIVVRIAEKMEGGLSTENLDRATMIVASVFSFGLDAGLVTDPIRTEITVENVAAVVRASEALAEVIRRTRDALISVGQSTGAGEILEALSADLLDGALDGRGAEGADPRIAATANLVSAQVIVEILTNSLNVGGTDVTQSMDSAIQQIMPVDATVALTGSVTVTEPILSQARIAADAAFNLLPDGGILLVRESLDMIPPGATPADAQVVLPSGSSDLLDSAVLAASLATDAELEVVNSTVRQGGGSSGSGPNAPPVINDVPPAQVTVGTPYNFTPTASDPDGDQLSFAISGKPAWLNFSPATGALTGAPGGADEGVYPGIQITVSDGADSAALEVFSITVISQPNGSPTIGGTPATDVTVGNPYTFTPIASDPDNDPLSFAVSGKPGWLNFDPATGTLSGTPVAGNEGVYPGIQLSVSDGADSATRPAFSLTVNGLPNQPPTIAGTPPTDVTVGNPYTFTPIASDPDNDPLSFAVSGKPGWLNFDPATGTLSGTPVAGNEGVYPGIQLSVSDSLVSASLAPFSITVDTLPNQPPNIGGVPTTEVTIDGVYDFTPTASDPDNDPLSFAISGMPAWLSFDSNTGRLSGTPVGGDEGTYSGIVISVSDGTEVSSIPVFEISVVAQILGSANLSWVAPTENSDGTNLTDLAGYKVYYGPVENNYPNVDTINNPTVTTYLVENLSRGTWVFVVTAFDNAGNESVYSDSATKVISP